MSDVDDALEACGQDPNWVCELAARTGNRTFAAAVDWFIDTPLTIVGILVVAWVVNRIARKSIRRLGDRMQTNATELRALVPGALRSSVADGTRATARAQTVSQVLRSMTTGLIVVIAALLVLGELGISLGPLLAGAGIAGVALGFGAQSLVRDMLAGLFVLIEDQYGVGDIIDAGPPVVGVVERVTLRTTRLRDTNGTVWHIGNGEILRVGNKSQNWARAVIDITVTHDADVDVAVATLSRVCGELATDEEWQGSRLIGEPEIWGVQALGPDGITLRAVVETEPASQFMVERELRRRIKRALDEEGIRLASVAGFLRPGGP